MKTFEEALISVSQPADKPREDLATALPHYVSIQQEVNSSSHFWGLIADTLERLKDPKDPAHHALGDLYMAGLMCGIEMEKVAPERNLLEFGLEWRRALDQLADPCRGRVLAAVQRAAYGLMTMNKQLAMANELARVSLIGVTPPEIIQADLERLVAPLGTRDPVIALNMRENEVTEGLGIAIQSF